MSGPSHDSSMTDREPAAPESASDLRDRFLYIGRVVWRESRLTAAATWSQVQRLVAYLRGRWTSHRQERKYVDAAVALGKRLEAAQTGDASLRRKLAELQERRQSFVAARESTRAIDAETRGLYVRLAEPYLESTAPPPDAEREHRRALALKVDIADRLDHQTQRRTGLFPPDVATRVRVAVGLGVAALVLMSLASAFRGTHRVGGLLLPPQVDLESLQPLSGIPLTIDTPGSNPADGNHSETREFEVAANAVLPARKVTVRYINGLPEGEVRSVDHEGRLISIERYRRGELNGLRERFYPDGEHRFSEVRFSNGVAQNTAIIWFPNGNTASRTEIVDGVPHGKSEIFFENGRKCVVTSYVNGEPHGQRYHYRPDETCFAIVKWEHGKPVSQEFLQIEVTAEDEAAIRERGEFSTRLVEHWK